jgi:hypothetical protein
MSESVPQEERLPTRKLHGKPVRSTSMVPQVFLGRGIYSGCDDIQSGDDLEMPEIGCCNGEAEMQGSGGNQEIFVGDRNSLSRAFAFDRPARLAISILTG